MYNKAILIGRLTAEPELKYTQSGTAVVSFRLAVERPYLSYVLADSSKFGKVAAVTISPLRDACILTDRMPDEIYLSQTIIKEVD